MGQTGHWVRVENPVGPGTPDVNYCIKSPYAEGWMELKCIPKWPVRATTPVRVPHYSPEQRVWHRERALAGGRVHVLLRVDETLEFLMFDGMTAALKLGNIPKEELLDAAVVHKRRVFPYDEILMVLTRAL